MPVSSCVWDTENNLPAAMRTINDKALTALDCDMNMFAARMWQARGYPAKDFQERYERVLVTCGCAYAPSDLEATLSPPRR
jgi:hypothetical protein